MTDEELIARLRQDDTDFWHCEAADRIEALVKDGAEWATLAADYNDKFDAQRKRAERLEALLREARTDLEDYVTQEYPKHAHPYFERQWNRDMELCRRIDAALKGADHV